MPSFVARLTSINRDLKLLWIALACLMLGFGIYSSIFFNFVTEKIGVSPDQMGFVESVRELPGFLCVAVAALSMHVVEPLLATIALALVAVGMTALAGVGNVPTLMIWSFVWSTGLHTWMPLCSSMVLSLSDEGNRGKRLGQTSAVGALGTAAGITAVLCIGHRLPYSTWFLLGGGCSAAATIALLRMRRDIGHIEKPRLVWKPRYRLYYVLTLLEGCRKQVFFTFAVFALTKVYHTHLRTIALLILINNVVNFIGSPIVGRLIDRVGERKILMFSYTAVFFVFIGYATAGSVHWLYVFYCLDNLFYLSTNCLTTYLRRIAEPEDVMPSLSMGVTMNHAAAVVVPTVGGLLWAKFSYPVTFFGGALVVLVSLFFAAKTGMKKSEARQS